MTRLSADPGLQGVLSASERSLDAAVRHAIDIRRWGLTEERRVVAFLKQDVYPDITAKVQRELDRISFSGGRVSRRSLARYQRMQDDVRVLVRAGFATVHDSSSAELLELAKMEAEWQAIAMRRAIPADIQLSLTRPAIPVLRAIARNDPIHGRTLRDWYAGISRDTWTGIESQMNIGISQGESIPQLIRRVRGTKAAGFKDGVYEVSTRNARAIVRTAGTHVSARARELTYADNDDVVEEVQYVATLDARTTDICASLDGRTFPIGEGPRPPMHMNCRSTTVPVFKSWKELGIDAKEISGDTRASMNGQVPASLTYNDWLKRMDRSPKTRHIVDEALGRGRAKLFREGVPMTRFVDSQHRPLTIAGIRKREGLD